jgi:hypothetical protein
VTARPEALSEKQRLDRRLDRALRDSFPASDPIAISVDHPVAPTFLAKPEDKSS